MQKVVLKITPQKSFNKTKQGTIIETIETHKQLNPKLFNGESLKPEIIDKINEIVAAFLEKLKEDSVKIKVKDIILLGSNASYNYTKDSDIDIHIVADTDSMNCPDDLYPTLYNAYRALFNKNIDVSFYGIPVELYVETTKSARHSNGVYSIKNNKWIKYPKIEELPNIDTDKIETLIQPFIDRFTKIRKTKLNVDVIDALIDDIYSLREKGMHKDNAEYSEENLCFKEFRNRGYLDKLKSMRNIALSKELSLEEKQSIKESEQKNYLASSEIYAMRKLLEQAVHKQVIVFNTGKFTITNIKESEVNRILYQLDRLDKVVDAHKVTSGKYDFTHMNFLKGVPARYFIVNGQLKLD